MVFLQTAQKLCRVYNGIIVGYVEVNDLLQNFAVHTTWIKIDLKVEVMYT